GGRRRRGRSVFPWSSSRVQARHCRKPGTRGPPRPRVCDPSGADQRSRAMQAYVWTKTFHLLFVMAWVAAVFYLPRILVNLAEAGDAGEVRARLVLMGTRLCRFGDVMFGLAVVLGLVLWMGFGIGGGWVHAKLLLVVLMLVHFLV